MTVTKQAFSLNFSLLSKFINEDEKNKYTNIISLIHEEMHASTSKDRDALGWIELATKQNKEEIEQILAVANEIRSQSAVLIVIGIGGSYLGAKAVQDALTPYFSKKSGETEVIYAGQNMSGAYINQLLQYVDDREVYVNVISKSGTTLEPAISFRVIKSYMEKRYGEEMKNRIILTTDPENGLLRKLASDAGYRNFEVPADVGGRFSVLTPVGLFPLAVGGIDIQALLDGAKQATNDLMFSNYKENEAYEYALSRYLLEKKGYIIEIMASFEPSLRNVFEWWKQLFGESEGKDEKGIFPVSVTYTTDLHSIGQYIQAGKRQIFETILHVRNQQEDCTIQSVENNFDQLNFLEDKTFHDINTIAKNSSILAHYDGGVPVIQVEIDKLDEYHLGYLLYFFEKACAMSAYLSGVNPFDQPGVESYKNNIFALLNKPGYETLKDELEERLSEIFD
ncbi:glucose-6-phosphate isomerase [Psychrobacillus sp. NEAU-3TGS]|uniref:glucose-6-phosphate isomerase n=1 Tax=Psychrobacillus sp. NEAU-3TGS TaxID=2995412 RepID=UPI0024982091|nr:glucose-6-phosphate isomerase [Psychrobacillus sp. NEAU-3TGS]MDI2589795.1 glucose-6-phosphate isomerase [Psychrobacillus sp. NEAU-3TGS]